MFGKIDNGVRLPIVMKENSMINSLEELNSDEGNGPDRKGTGGGEAPKEES